MFVCICYLRCILKSISVFVATRQFVPLVTVRGCFLFFLPFATVFFLVFGGKAYVACVCVQFPMFTCNRACKRVSVCVFVCVCVMFLGGIFGGMQNIQDFSGIVTMSNFMMSNMLFVKKCLHFMCTHQ